MRNKKIKIFRIWRINFMIYVKINYRILKVRRKIMIYVQNYRIFEKL